MEKQSINESVKPQPGIIAFTNPFRLVLKDNDDEWAPSLEDINNSTYDYVKLNRLSTSFDIGLPYPLHLLVGFDGSLVIPAIEEYRSNEKAIETFNQLLGEMLFGGVYFEPIEPGDLSRCLLFETGYVRSIGFPYNPNARFHNELRSRLGSSYNSIVMIDPPRLTAFKMHESRKKGKNICSTITNFSVSFALHGLSSYISHHWANALSNFWIGVEQVISYLWDKEIIHGGKHPSILISGRREFLNDTRTWTTSTQIEMLYQLSVIDQQTYQFLSQARKARNRLVHNGKTPSREVADDAFQALFRLISLSVSDRSDSLSGIMDQYRSIDPISRFDLETTPRTYSTEEVKYWREGPPPLPGEPDWGDKEYEESGGPMIEVESTKKPSEKNDSNSNSS